MMDKNKTRVKCLSAGGMYDRQKKRRKRHYSSSDASYCGLLLQQTSSSVGTCDVSCRQIDSKKNANKTDLPFIHLFIQTYYVYHSSY